MRVASYISRLANARVILTRCLGKSGLKNRDAFRCSARPRAPFGTRNPLCENTRVVASVFASSQLTNQFDHGCQSRLQINQNDVHRISGDLAQRSVGA